MEYTELKEYFSKYVRQYLPYKDDEFFQIITAFLDEEYLYNTYVDIPEKFKILFEEHTISTTLYDIILQSVGYPLSLLNNMPLLHKEIILNRFTDYARNKSELGFIRELCTSFNESINVYELYIDFKYVSRDYNWYFIPSEIYQSIKERMDPIDYDEVYHGVPTYYIPKEHFNNLYSSHSITLPIKSNLIMISLSSSKDSDELYNLTSAATLYYFKEDYVVLKMKDSEFTITLMGLYQLWNYVLSYFRGIIQSADVNRPVTYYDLTGSSFPYTIESGLPNSIDRLMMEYEMIEDPDVLMEFYKEKVQDVFQANIPTVIKTVDGLRRSLIYNVDIELVKYCENKIDDSESDRLSETYSLLNYFRESLMGWIAAHANTLMPEYQDYLIDNFELSLLVPTNTTTWRMIEHFKPFHTQLLARHRKTVINKSKFNRVLVRDHYRMFVTRDFPVTVCAISTELWFSERIDGECNFVQDSDLVIVTEGIANQFKFDGTEYIYCKPDDGSYFEIENAVKVLEVNENGGMYMITLEKPYAGISTFVQACYRRYHLPQDGESDYENYILTKHANRYIP